jgi:hypothetical protein
MSPLLRDLGLRPKEPELYQGILPVVKDGRLGQDRERRSPVTLGMEIEHLDYQLVEQERLHGEHVQEERRARWAAEQAGQ